MRENVKKLIDLMESENWTAKSIPRGEACVVNCFAPKDTNDFAIVQDGSAILLEDGCLHLEYLERRYFHDVRGRIYDRYVQKETARLEEKLNNFLKNK